MYAAMRGPEFFFPYYGFPFLKYFRSGAFLLPNVAANVSFTFFELAILPRLNCFGFYPPARQYVQCAEPVCCQIDEAVVLFP